MKLSVFTDEISDSVDRALELAAAWKLSHVEVRSIGEDRFPRGSDHELAEMGRKMEDAALQVSAVSPGFFKCVTDDPGIEADISEGLPRACEWARKWGTEMVSSFAFRRGEGPMPSVVVDYLGRMADVVSAQGCRLLLENESSCWGATGTEAEGIIRQLGSERIGLCWDPGNSVRFGGDPASEFTQIRDLIEHVHVKEFDATARSWTILDRGVVGWPALVPSLRKEGYDGFLIVETHTAAEFDLDGDLAGKEANTQHNLQFLRQLLDSA